MFEENTLKELLQKQNEAYKTNWEFAIEEAWKATIEYVCHDMDGFIEYIDTNLSAAELYALSSIFEDIAEKSQSREFIASLRRAVSRLPDVSPHAILPWCVDFAEGFISA